MLLEQNDAEVVEALLQDLIAQFPEDAGGYRLLCKLYLSLERWRDALEVASRARDPALCVLLANDLIDKDRPQEALEVIAGTRGLVSDDATWFRLELATGTALDTLGLEEDAVAHYDRAAMLKPDHAGIFSG